MFHFKKQVGDICVFRCLNMLNKAIPFQMQTIKRCNPAVLLFLTGLFCYLPLGAQKKSGDWELKSEKDDMKVYYKKNAGVHKLKITTSIKTTLSGITQLFNEVENYKKWGYKITESKLLKKVSDTEVYYYVKLDFPWPMDDRDLIMHTTLEQDPKTQVVRSVSKAVPDYLPENKGIVRIKEADTKWTMYPGTDDWLYIEYELFSDPGGSIPDWAVNFAIDIGPTETIKSVRTLLKDSKYQSAKLAYIKERKAE
jgi:START domain